MNLSSINKKLLQISLSVCSFKNNLTKYLLYILLSISSFSISHGLIVKNPGNQNYRLYSDTLGPSPSAPPNPIFIGKDYDLSGVAISAMRGSDGHAGGGMMISPHYYVTATHFAGATSYNFRNRDGVIITKPTEGGRAMINILTNGNTDLFIGKLAGDGITAADKISMCPIMMESSNQNWNWYINKQILVYSMNGGNSAGFNTITQVTDSGVLGLIGKSIFFNYSGAYTNQAGINGESGSPWLLLWNGQAYAGGAHSGYYGTASASSNYTSVSSFIPAFADQIDAYIAESYPAEKIIRESITNSAPRITGTSNMTFLPNDTSKTYNLEIKDDNLPINSVLTISASSSNQSLLSDNAIVLSNTVNAKTLQITPLPNVSGNVTITVSVSDGQYTTTKDYNLIIVNTITGLPTSIQGGSFETPLVSGFLARPSGSGWFFSGGSLIQANGSAYAAAAAPDGIQTANLQNTSMISQPINLAAGSYVIYFKAARRSSGGIQPVRISIDDNQIGGLITPSSTSFGSYNTATFTVTTGAHVLRIEGVNGYGDNNTFIGQIVLAPPVVELPSFALGGSFETPQVAGFQYNPVGSGWTFSPSSAIHANGCAWNAPYTTNGIGSITQTLSVPAGSYAVSYKAARRPSNQIQPVKLSIDGVQVGGLMTPTSEAYEVYTSAVFTIPAGQHTLRLEATNSLDDRSTFIDNVRFFAVTPSTSYNDWSARHITLTPAQQMPNVDPDNDGMLNLLEFAFGLNPTKPDVIPLTAQKNENQFLLTYTRPYALQNINYMVEYSDDMTTNSWISSGVITEVVNDDGITQTVRSIIPLPEIGINNSQRRFARVKVGNN